MTRFPKKISQNKNQRVQGNLPSPDTFPMRINKYLAVKNYSTRRGADDIIKSRKVFINGKLAKPGDRVSATDKVEVRFRGKMPPAFSYFAFNKPIGMTTGVELGKNVIDIIGSLPKNLQNLKLFPIGRLDKNSHGLIILTNDGRVTDRLLNPKFNHDKEYEVITRKPLRANFKEKLEGQLSIEGDLIKPAKTEQIGKNRFRITLTEGKTHQVRRMVSGLFNEVSDLNRIRILNIRLGSLRAGLTRQLAGKELADFLKNLGL